MARRIAIFIAAILALLGIAFTGLIVWATSEKGARFMSNELKSSVRDKSKMDISFAKVEFDLFPPRLRVQSITAVHLENKLSCTVDEAELAPSIVDLFTKTLTVEEAYLGSPQCTVRLEKKDIDELLSSDTDQKSSKALDVSSLPGFEVFAITDADFRIEIDDPDRLGTIKSTIDGLSLDITADKSDIEVRALLERLDGHWREGEKQAAETLTQLKCRAAISRDAVDVRHLSAHIAGGDLRLRDAHIPLPVWPSGPDVAELSISMPLDVVNRLPIGAPEIAGTISYDGQISARKDTNQNIGLFARGKLNANGIRVDEFVVGDLAAEFALTPKGVAFSNTVLQAADGSLSLAGNVAFDEKLTTDIQTNLNGIELGRLLEQVTVGGSYVTQYMTGPAHVTGTLNPLMLTADVKINVKDHITRTSSFRDKKTDVVIHIPDVSVAGEVAITDTTVDAKKLTVRRGNSRVSVDLYFDFPKFSWRLDARSDDLHLEDVHRLLGYRVGGNGPLRCVVSGPLDDPGIVARGDFRQLLIEDMDFDHVATELHYKNLLLTLENLDASRGASRAHTPEILFDFNAKGGLAISTKMTTKRVLAEELLDLFQIDGESWGSPTGDLAGDVAIEYNLSPEQFFVHADVVHQNLQIFGEKFGTDVLKVDWNDGELVVRECGLRKGKGTIEIKGTVSHDQKIDFQGTMKDVEAAAVNFKPFRKLGIDAIGEANAHIRGTMDRPTGDVEVNLKKTKHNGIAYGKTRIALNFDGFKVNGKGNLLGKKIQVEHLKLNLKKERFQIEGYVQNLDLVPIFDIAPAGREAELRITGDLSLGGRLSAHPNLHGAAELMGVHARVNELKFTNKRPLSMRVESSQFNIQKTRFFGPDVIFDLSGGIGLEKMNIKANGVANLTSVSSMINGVRTTKGELSFEIRTSGPILGPSLRGTADLKNGMVRLNSFPHDIENISGHMTFSPKFIKLQDFAATSADGTLKMNGDISLISGSIKDYTFRLKAKDLELTPFESLTFKVSTVKNGLTLRSGRRGGLPHITGDAELRDLRYTQDIRILELTDLNVDRLAGKRTSPTTPKLIDPKDDFFSFEIRLHGTKNLEAHNNLFDADLVIDDVAKPLRFVGTNQTYGFLGRILGKRGQVRFAGRRFDVKYAYVDFQDADRPENPNFQVIADGQIRDWKVTLTAEGNIEEYEIGFASQPYLPKEDIAFLILTGMTKAENRQFGSKGINLGMPLLGQLGPGGGDLPVELQVYSEYSESAGTDTTRIAMGRWISEDIWVSVSSSVGQTRDVEAQVDYRMNDELSVSAGYEDKDEGSVGNVGVDLKFRLEF